MILSHLILGFVTSYVGFTPPSMLNLTASRIYIENNKETAFQFIIGASIIVLFQVFLAVKISETLESYPQLIYWVQNLAIIVFAMLSLFFIYKGLSIPQERNVKPVKNGFIWGLSLSSVNMFAIPFFAVAHSFFVMHGWATSELTCTSVFGIGTVLGTFAVLSCYLFLAKKFETKLIAYSKYFTLFIGLITGSIAIYSVLKLYI